MKTTRGIIKTILGFGFPIPRMIRPLVKNLYLAGMLTTETLIFLRKFFWVDPVLRSVCAQVGHGLRTDRLPYIRGKGALSLGDNVNLSGRSCFAFMRGVSETPSITIGDNVFIGNGCVLAAGTTIAIGNNCLVSGGTRIQDNDGHPLDAHRRGAGEKMALDNAKPITIEDDVWIGASVIVLKGVRIGARAIVGAGAVVTRDVPPDTVVAGNPATVLKFL
jgi:acetyltransferase-like isoleucine patch superfamily enzyme